MLQPLKRSEEETQDFVNQLASCLQSPGSMLLSAAAVQLAAVSRAEESIGKGALVQFLARILGQATCSLRRWPRA